MMDSMNQFLMISLITCFFITSHSQSTSPGQRCLPDQSSALLQFKQSFTIKKNAYSSDTSYPKVKSWKAGTDCCSWDGVTCGDGQVIGLDLFDSWLFGTISSNSSLFSLGHLQRLDLTFNDFNLSVIPPEFGKLTRLTHLDLSYSNFSGEIPLEITWLTKLVSLDLSSSEYDSFESSSLLHLERPVLVMLIQSLKNLKELHLNYVNISSSILENLTNLTSLTSLSLKDCQLQGEFPQNVFLLPDLQTIHLSDNQHLSGFLPEFHSGTSLRILDLSSTNFVGELPYSIGNLSQLTYLSLSSNNFNGDIPSSLGNLSQLTALSLADNNFSGPIPSTLANLKRQSYFSVGRNHVDGVLPTWLANLTQLFFLDISDNHLSGPVLSDLSRIPNLYYLDLSFNSLTGSIPSSLFTIPSLNYLWLNHNQLSGPLIFQNISSSQLEYLYLSNNNLMELEIFSELKKLSFLDLSGNNRLSITNVSLNSTFLRLKGLRMSSCNVNQFPEFLKYQSELISLDLSDNKIEGKIPQWFWNVGKKTLSYLNVSYNFLSGLEQPPTILPWIKMEYLDLRSNLLQGPLPVPPLSTHVFFASKNEFTGEIPQIICKLTSLNVLDLSSNHLSGLVPDCLANVSSSLSVLNLQRNNFHGDMPETFTTGSRLRTIDFSHNQLHGKVPQSLVNCKNLEVLNLGNNHINDTFPFHFESLPELQVLVLRSNKLHGPIWKSETNFSFPKLRIIDVSYNDFTGNIPSEYFRSWKSMMTVLHPDQKYMGESSIYYQDTVTVMNKGIEMKLVKILTIFTAIDLSNNKFHGPIPATIGNFKSLIVLNLSSNSFTGRIPISFGNLIELESLDLSQNKLSGRIPQELRSLTFLEVLNLSQNQLKGLIPQGGQFDTFNISSFEGNSGLCGSPLPNKCDTTPPKSTSQHTQSDSTTDLNWIVIFLGYGSGLIVGIVIGHIITSNKRGWFMRTFGRERLRQI